MHKHTLDTAPSVWRYIVSGLMIAGLPVMVLALHIFRITTGTPIRLETEIVEIDDSGLANVIRFQTPLNHLSTNNLTGENTFVIGDNIYVFLSSGPHDIWYPYAISKRPPETGCRQSNCLVMAGKISAVQLDAISISYDFETYYTTAEILAIAQDNENEPPLEMTLAVNNAGNSIIKNLNISGQILDHRNMLKFAPPAFNSLGAKSAPATNPPK